MTAPINSGSTDGSIAASTGRLNRGMTITTTGRSAVTIAVMPANIGVGAAGERKRADRFIKKSTASITTALYAGLTLPAPCVPGHTAWLVHRLSFGRCKKIVRYAQTR